jgi:hypothetical protein
MNKKLNIVLLVILTASLMISTASASNLDDHKAGIGKMAHPTSSAGIEVCKGCHDPIGSTTTSGFCTGCHAFPVFPATATSAPTVVATSAPTVVATSAPTVTLTATAAPTVVATIETPKEEETKETTETKEEKESPGFGIVSTIAGLFALFLVKRNYK